MNQQTRGRGVMLIQRDAYVTLSAPIDKRAHSINNTHNPRSSGMRHPFSRRAVCAIKEDSMNSPLPLARQADSIVQEMDGELVIYHANTAQASVLNQTAAVIWKLCDGKTSVREIAQRAAQQLNAPVDEAFVQYTLAQLSKKNLLEASVTMPLNFKGMTRRDFLRSGALGAAVILPVVVTMTAPKVTQAASCAGEDQPCLVDQDCCVCCCEALTCQAP